MEKNILILCCGYPYATDLGFGCHVARVLMNMKLPENVDLMEVGFSACMVPHIIEGKDKLIVIDIFNTEDEPGKIICLSQAELIAKGNIKKDPAKVHLIETLEQIQIIGKCPETVFIGVVPIDTETEGEQLTPEIQNRIADIIQMIMKEINSVPSK